MRSLFLLACCLCLCLMPAALADEPTACDAAGDAAIEAENFADLAEALRQLHADKPVKAIKVLPAQTPKLDDEATASAPGATDTAAGK